MTIGIWQSLSTDRRLLFMSCDGERVLGGMMPKTIFIVEDSRAWLNLLCRIFRGNGYDVLTACSCAGAVEKIEMSGYDCLVLDFNLPDGNALEVCAAARKSKNRSSPILIFSSDAAAEKCLLGESRADSLLPKTASAEKLLATVGELMAIPRD